MLCSFYNMEQSGLKVLALIMLLTFPCVAYYWGNIQRWQEGNDVKVISPQSSLPLKTALYFCDCIHEVKPEVLKRDDLREMYDTCYARMDRDTAMILLHSIYGSGFIQYDSWDSTVNWFELFQEYVELKDSLCPLWSTEDEVFMPNVY